MKVLPKRFDNYSLTIHPEKTHIVEVTRSTGREERKGSGCFDFLGFTHYWGKSKRGRWYIRRKTEKSRFTRSLKCITGWCKKHRHLPLRE